MTQQVVTYEISAKEHEQALREFIEGKKTEDGMHGFIPLRNSHGIQDVDFTLLDDGGASVSVIYEGKAEEKKAPAKSKEAAPAPAESKEAQAPTAPASEPLFK